MFGSKRKRGIENEPEKNDFYLAHIEVLEFAYRAIIKKEKPPIPQIDHMKWNNAFFRDRADYLKAMLNMAQKNDLNRLLYIEEIKMPDTEAYLLEKEEEEPFDKKRKWLVNQLKAYLQIS